VKRIGLVIATVALLALAITPVSKADDFTVANLAACDSANSSNCIVSITAVFPNGNRVVAESTGRHAEVVCQGVNGLTHKCTYDEWSVKGLKNEDGSDLIQTNGWIQPPSQYGNSNFPPGGLIFLISSSGWAGQKKIQSPKCSDARYNCNTSYDLEPDVSFEVAIQEDLMEPSYTTGTLDGGKVITKNAPGSYMITYSGRPGHTVGLFASLVPGTEVIPESPDWSQYFWSVRTIDAKEAGGLGTHGIDCHGANPSLMTDALWVGLPSFDSSSKEVTLDVNNPHLDVNGNVATGVKPLCPTGFHKA